MRVHHFRSFALFISTLLFQCLAQTPNVPGIAQNQNNVAADGLEIRGTVVEPGMAPGAAAIGVGGALVTLTEYRLVDNTVTPVVIATASSDSRGEFKFRPLRLSEYIVDVKKDGYLTTGPISGIDRSGTMRYVTSRSITMTREKPVQEIHFVLTRRGELTGRVVDEDGKPVSDLRVRIQGRGLLSSVDMTTTGEDGIFAASELQPGPYAVGTLAKSGDPAPVSPFSEADTKAVAEDFEIAYWPGVTSQEAASPWIVIPGGSTNLPDLRVRRMTTYRAHVLVDGVECAEYDRWTFRALPYGQILSLSLGRLEAEEVQLPCGKEFLIRNLRPGSYWFALWSGRREVVKTWALTPVEIKEGNIQVRMSLSKGTDITGRLVPAEGVRLPAVDSKTYVFAGPLIGGLPFAKQATPDAAGGFLMQNVPLTATRLQPILPKSYYVQAIRYNGRPVVDGLLPLSPGGSGNVEIVIDDRPATVQASVMEGDKPYLQATVAMVKWPMPPPGNPGVDLPQESRLIWGGRDDGIATSQFQMEGLAPGEYRIFAIARELRTKVLETGMVERLAGQGQKVTLERGGSQNITLKLSDPSR